MTILANSTLSPREEAFCLGIVEGLSESDAYRKAYRPQRAKAKTIHEKACRIFRRAKVRARIKELMRPLIEQAQMNRQEWLESLVRIIRADVRKMFDSHGKPRKVTDLEPNEAAAIAAFETYASMGGVDGSDVIGGTLRVRLVDKLKALELYGKAMGYFDELRGSSEVSIAPRSIKVKFVKSPTLDSTPRREGTCEVGVISRI